MGIRMTHDETMKEFLELACNLSPENLSCDGELPTSEIRKRKKRLISAWHILENNVGHKVSEEDVWRWSTKQRSNTTITG